MVTEEYNEKQKEAFRDYLNIANRIIKGIEGNRFIKLRIHYVKEDGYEDICTSTTTREETKEILPILLRFAKKDVAKFNKILETK